MHDPNIDTRDAKCPGICIKNHEKPCITVEESLFKENRFPYVWIFMKFQLITLHFVKFQLILMEFSGNLMSNNQENSEKK